MSECLCLFPNGQIYRQDVPDYVWFYQWGIPKYPDLFNALEDGPLEYLHERVELHRIELWRTFPFGVRWAFVPTTMTAEQGWEAIFQAIFKNTPNEIHPELYWRESEW